MRIRSVLIPFALTALLLAGCSNGEVADDGAEAEAEAETHEASVTAMDNEFDPADLEVPAGEVELVLDNTGEATHNFVNEELGIKVEADGGEQATTTFTAEPGTYEFVCEYHESLGMVGTLTVTE